MVPAFVAAAENPSLEESGWVCERASMRWGETETEHVGGDSIFRDRESGVFKRRRKGGQIKRR